MRKLFILGVLLASGAAFGANSSETLNIQGILRDSSGSLQSMAVGLDVNLYATETASSPFYTQHFTTVAVDNGFFTVELAGAGLNFSGMPDAWVGVQVAGDPAELPRQHLDATPYAFSAGSADSLSAACSGCVSNAMVATGLSASKISGKVAQASTADTAAGLSCTGCVTDTTVATGISASKISGKVAQATTADSAGSATTATTASNLSCTGCITGAKVATGTISGSNLVSNGSHSHGITVRIATATGAAGGIANVTAGCASGETLVGGACDPGGTGATIYSQRPNVTSNPTSFVCFYSGGTGTLTTNAFCMSINSASLP